MMKNRFRRLLLLALCALLMLAAVGCSSTPDLGEPLLTLEGQAVSENMIQLLMARVKGNLQLSGYTVSQDSFWEQIVGLDGMRYDEYTRQLVIATAKEYLAAAVLFEERGLTLPQKKLDEIDAELEEMIQAAGSKAQLNQTLAGYGANLDILRALYVLEAKVAALRLDLYGTDGALISEAAQQQYLEKEGIAFRRLLLRSQCYKYVKDQNGDEIYYLDNNDGKTNTIAYDKVNGSTRRDKDGEIIKDSNGDEVYYTSTGSIAYDKENGKRAFENDKNGDPVLESFSAEILAAHRKEAGELLERLENAGAAEFEAVLAEYAAKGDEYSAESDLCFLYKSDNGTEEMSDLADVLQWRPTDTGGQEAVKPGDIVSLETENGIYILMRYDLPADATSNSTYSAWFTELPERVAVWLFSQECAPYVERVQLDEERYAALPSMAEIGINTRY